MSDLSTSRRFSILPAGDAWRWATFSLSGEPRSSGLAATRAIAAAFVIRDICQAQAGTQGAAAGFIHAKAA
jgi:hypothetical protein